MENMGKEFADALGSFITEYRKSCHPQLSLRGFAEKSGVSRMVICDLEAHNHSGNLLSDTISKISNGLDLENSYQLQDIIKKRMKSPKQENTKANERIILLKDSNLYALFEVVKDLSDHNIEMLHNIALELKK